MQREEISRFAKAAASRCGFDENDFPMKEGLTFEQNMKLVDDWYKGRMKKIEAQTAKEVRKQKLKHRKQLRKDLRKMKNERYKQNIVFLKQRLSIYQHFTKVIFSRWQRVKKLNKQTNRKLLRERQQNIILRRNNHHLLLANNVMLSRQPYNRY